jgi:signal transduction histidine kinase
VPSDPGRHGPTHPDGTPDQRFKKGNRVSVKKATYFRIAISVVLIACVAVGGYIVTVKVADYQREQYFEVRKFQAAASAASLDASQVESLTGRPSDADTKAFKSVRAQLQRIKNSDMRMRFVYLMRPVNGKMVFLVDAEASKSHDYSAPGDIYYEARPAEFYPFQGKSSADPWVMGPIHDRWGNWISANAYIIGSDGKPTAVLGTDVSVDRALASFNQIRNIGIVYDALACVLLALLLAQWILWRYGKDKREAMHREMDASIIRLNEELQEADRLKSEFIESASHELRGPVTAVNTAIMVVDNHVGPDITEQGRELLGIAKAGTQRLVTLANNLLDMSRLQSEGVELKREEVDVADIARDTVKVFSVLAHEKGIDIDVAVHGDELAADVDPEVVRRVLENLVSNAIKYTDEGSIVVDVDAGADAVTFTVTDTGRGIPEEYEGEVFGKFSRLHHATDSRERGTGLGLAISKGLVERHGGKIWFESEAGKGSSFHFEIPRD